MVDGFPMSQNDFSAKSNVGNLIPSSRQGPLPSSTAALRMKDITAPHIQSFNYMLDEGLAKAIADIPHRELKLSSGDTLHFWVEDAMIGKPMKSALDGQASDPRLFPAECRERGMTYAAPLAVTIARRINNEDDVVRVQAKLGDIPIMVGSNRCHLAGLTPSELVGVGEEATEYGGYFICNGIERLVRMLQLSKRNYPMAITRSAYTNRGPLYSNKGVVMRCTRSDQSSVTIVLHYLTDGSATVRFTVKKQEFFLPVILVLKALIPTTDREIYERILAGDVGNTYLSDRIFMLLRDAKRLGDVLSSRESALAYLGGRFRMVLDVPESWTDVQVGQALLDRYILVHLNPSETRDKFNLLLLMLRKLYAFVAGSVTEDNADALSNHEIMLSGHFLLNVIKEKIYEFTQGVAESMRKEDSLAQRQAAARAKSRAAKASGDGEAVTTGEKKLLAIKAISPVDVHDLTYFRKIMDRQPSVGRRIYQLMATGNLVSSSGLDLMQVSGYTVVADKLNYLRFSAHFRSVHRGQFFTEMKTTTVRKLLPDNWGFFCPVHTPDGGLCGLLNHLTTPATITSFPLNESNFLELTEKAAADAKKRASKATAATQAPPSLSSALTALLVALGMDPFPSTGGVLPATYMPVILDGKLLGGAPPHTVYRISRAIRRAKALTGGVKAIPESLNAGTMPFQPDAILNLSRAAVLGLSNPDTVPGSRVPARGRNILGRPQPQVAGGEGMDGAASADAALSIGLPELGAIGVVPPSMEVAFVPPAWWDVEVDPHIQDDAKARVRAAMVSFIANKTSCGKEFFDADGQMKEDAVNNKKSKGTGTGLPWDDDPVPPTKLVGPYPGLFLSTAPQRLVRPVIQLDTGLVELISPLEQPFMDIAVTAEDIEVNLHRQLKVREAEKALAKKDKKKDKKKSKKHAANDSDSDSDGEEVEPPILYTHIEVSALSILSELASLTPFSDMNQSPRNMYQCQMAKQTMGTPSHALSHRTDSKIYRLLTPQAPLVQNKLQREFGLDDYPNGTNACVAVISYTGYDLEDACIINKSSFERGMGWTSVYKNLDFDLTRDRSAEDSTRFLFHNTYLKGEQRVRLMPTANADQDAATAPTSLAVRPGDKVCPTLDEDGLPPIGLKLREGDPMYCYLDTVTGTHKIARHNDSEPAYVEEVRIMGPVGTSNAAANEGIRKIGIKLRYDRRQVVGDKFASRAGQKGVLSFLWPQHDMPFTDSGMTPDIIINPHAFPSRMTVGMLVESMAGKVGALSGKFQDSTPFRFDDNHSALEHFGEQLARAGYAYHGTETMTSGITGETLGVEIYYGVVYYQRLRHMVNDKAQVRSTGPINPLTRQPVKGRKRGGGIRFGEMERDALLAHGASFLLNDRLHNSSDRHVALVCKSCGSILSPFSAPAPITTLSLDKKKALSVPIGDASQQQRVRREAKCGPCGEKAEIYAIPMPYVFRYLANELAGMGVRIRLEVGEAH